MISLTDELINHSKEVRRFKHLPSELLPGIDISFP